MSVVGQYQSTQDRPWLDPTAKPFLEMEGLTKKFGAVTAVEDVHAKIFRGEIFCLLGGSGCGKTTLLRMLAGFETPTSGRVVIDGVDVTHTSPYDRPVNMMFQSYALFPHMTVEKNIGYGLKHEKMTRAEARDRVREMLELVQLAGYEHRKPGQLSGGQRQRVALARALAKQPKLLLLDEPLGALDKKLRTQTQFELMNIQYKVGVTFLVVTHDQEEAMALSSRIAVMNKGRIVQVGTPTQIYEFPNSRFTADFIGSVNMFDAVVEARDGDRTRLNAPDLDCELLANFSGSLSHGARVSVAVRPEKIAIGRNEPKNRNYNALRGQVWDLGYFGNHSLYRVKLPNGRVIQVTRQNERRASDDERTVDWEDQVWLSWDSSDALVLVE